MRWRGAAGFFALVAGAGAFAPRAAPRKSFALAAQRESAPADSFTRAQAIGVLLIGPATLLAASESARATPPPTPPLADEASSVSVAAAAAVDFPTILQRASKKALGGGKSGALAGVTQVLLLMWLRTTMNYQYRYGASTKEALDTLWSEGGVRRLYRGLPFALVQGPLSRFGDTAANVGVLAVLDATPSTALLPTPLKTAVASVVAGTWRILITPVDTVKTTLQVGGSRALPQLIERSQAEGPLVLWDGALGNAAATFVGHWPWFTTYNLLSENIPTWGAEGELVPKLVRAAALGLGASCVSDCCSNSIRVIKTTKQTAPERISYADAARQVIDEDGVTGLLGRGLQTRLLVNALQGTIFAVLWKYFEQRAS